METIPNLIHQVFYLKHRFQPVTLPNLIQQAFYFKRRFQPVAIGDSQEYPLQSPSITDTIYDQKFLIGAI
jgi:hypothetical protein